MNNWQKGSRLSWWDYQSAKQCETNFQESLHTKHIKNGKLFLLRCLGFQDHWIPKEVCCWNIKYNSRKFKIIALILFCIIFSMFKFGMPTKVQSTSHMNHIYTSNEGGELWLGDYYAATNLNLLKQKNIKSGKFLVI